MNTLTNTGRRRLGLPGRPAIVLDPGQTVEISDGQLKAIMANSTSARWVNSGVLSLNGNGGVDTSGANTVDASFAAATKLDIPEKLTGSGVELYDRGGGWWDIYVNGFKVLDKSVRRAKAEELAEEYR